MNCAIMLVASIQPWRFVIRDYRAIRSFRNILAHAYDHVEDSLVWGIIERDLDNLIEDVERII